jgi:hypothetical protein
MILCNAANDHSVGEIIIATLVAGIILLAAIPFFEILAKKCLDNEK